MIIWLFLPCRGYYRFIASSPAKISSSYISCFPSPLSYFQFSISHLSSVSAELLVYFFPCLYSAASSSFPSPSPFFYHNPPLIVRFSLSFLSPLYTSLKIICFIIRRTYPISVDVLLYGHNASQANRMMNVQYSLLNFFSFVLACIAQVL